MSADDQCSTDRRKGRAASKKRISPRRQREYTEHLAKWIGHGGLGKGIGCAL
jgi:hypothetical protein